MNLRNGTLRGRSLTGLPHHLRDLAIFLVVVVFGVISVRALTQDSSSEPTVSYPNPSPAVNPARVTREQGNATNYSDYAYGLKSFAATSDKSQTKLWYAKGSWWAVMTRVGGGSGIFKLGSNKRTWQDTGVTVDPRERTYADVIYTADGVFIASRTSTGALAVTHFVKTDNKNAPWSLAPDFPVAVARGGASSLSIDRDSRGRVWATFNQGGRIWVTASDATATRWSQPAPVTGPNAVTNDDTAAVVAANGRLNLMYSDQVVGAFRFGSHEDGNSDSTIKMEREPAASGLRIADGHIRLLAARNGRIFAAVKTSLGDVRTDPPNSPLLGVLYRDRGVKSWTFTVAASTKDQMTRPQIVLNKSETQLYFVATSPQSGGRISFKIADTDLMSFGAGPGTLLLAWPGAVINNATVGRERVDDKTGLVVLASDSSQGRYFHAVLPLRRESG